MNERTTKRRKGAGGIASTAFVFWAACAVCFAQDAGKKGKPKYRGQLGAKSTKIRRDGDKTFLWAGGDRNSADADWYDFSGSDINPEELQFGIGKDRIKAIDDPMFVSPDDPRLLELRHNPYRSEQKPKTNNDIRVIGYAVGDDVRAYPVALLDRHELVNDRVGGKPVTVGW